jgi:hypothetical protein
MIGTTAAAYIRTSGPLSTCWTSLEADRFKADAGLETRARGQHVLGQLFRGAQTENVRLFKTNRAEQLPALRLRGSLGAARRRKSGTG